MNKIDIFVCLGIITGFALLFSVEGQMNISTVLGIAAACFVLFSRQTVFLVKSGIKLLLLGVVIEIMVKDFGINPALAIGGALSLILVSGYAAYCNNEEHIGVKAS